MNNNRCLETIYATEFYMSMLKDLRIERKYIFLSRMARQLVQDHQKEYPISGVSFGKYANMFAEKNETFDYGIFFNYIVDNNDIQSAVDFINSTPI